MASLEQESLLDLLKVWDMLSVSLRAGTPDCTHWQGCISRAG